MHEQYHEQFWVLAGTTAPVIGLALTVAAGEMWGKTLEDREWERAVYALIWGAWVVAVADFVAMFLLLGFSLASLRNRADTTSLTLNTGLALFGVAGLLAVTFLTAVVKVLTKGSGKSPANEQDEDR
jgi:predicted Kef-type K+ transport protein